MVLMLVASVYLVAPSLMRLRLSPVSACLGVTRVQLLSGDRQGNVDELARKDWYLPGFW